MGTVPFFTDVHLQIGLAPGDGGCYLLSGMTELG
jgi:hypothetical protein